MKRIAVLERSGEPREVAGAAERSQRPRRCG